ncbi:MAG TPA: MupA/Atu3671 family FMN-dependent luciferase-like monooxygenase, partial [Pyrinomonadaceae bacterium]|nr:MupA/Atu3671 family FMN-dependent luciferase-like monooxygenase [Pyrinomonadaceae bacterium]
QRLWRGQTITARDGAGKPCELRILPRPIQPEPPIWLTCSGDPQMFVKAGELGFNVLTALLSQSVEEMAGKLKLYRDARERHGHDPDAGRVTVMIHTFVGDDEQSVLSRVRAPLSDYLKAHVGLIETMTQSLDIKVNIDKEQYLDHLVAFAFERYYQTASLIGTPEKCLPMVERLKAVGVNELACFIDFGVEVEAVLGGLRHLNTLRQLSTSRRAVEGAGAESRGSMSQTA